MKIPRWFLGYRLCPYWVQVGIATGFFASFGYALLLLFGVIFKDGASNYFFNEKPNLILIIFSNILVGLGVFIIFIVFFIVGTLLGLIYELMAGKSRHRYEWKEIKHHFHWKSLVKHLSF